MLDTARTNKAEPDYKAIAHVVGVSERTIRRFDAGTFGKSSPACDVQVAFVPGVPSRHFALCVIERSPLLSRTFFSFRPGGYVCSTIGRMKTMSRRTSQCRRSFYRASLFREKGHAQTRVARSLV